MITHLVQGLRQEKQNSSGVGGWRKWGRGVRQNLKKWVGNIRRLGPLCQLCLAKAT